jgi:hypothetical protein
MLSEYLKIALRESQTKTAKAELRTHLEKLPLEDLYKIAMGQKLSHESTTAPDGEGWLEQFKGTAMLPQAVELERRSIELEAAQAQAYAANEEGCREKDQLNIQKRLLEVQLAEGEALPVDPAHAEQVAGEADAGMDAQQDEAAAAEEAAMMGGVPGEGGAPDGEEGAPPAEGEEPKAKSEDKPAPKKEEKKPAPEKKEATAMLGAVSSSPQMSAEGLGAAKTPSMAQPSAVVPGMKMAEAVGRRMAQMDKEALDLKSLAQGAAGVMNKANIGGMRSGGAVMGAGLGAAAGALGGASKDQNGERHMLRGALTGAAGGAALGGVAHGMSARMGKGLTAGQAAGSMVNNAKRGLGMTQKNVTEAGATPVRKNYTRELGDGLHSAGPPQIPGQTPMSTPTLVPPVAPNPNALDPRTMQQLAEVRNVGAVGAGGLPKAASVRFKFAAAKIRLGV